MGLPLFGLALGIGLLELTLRLIYPAPPGFAVWEPGLHEVFDLQPGLIQGVQGEAHFIVNSAGLRGDEIPLNPSVTSILAVGGSTTESLYIDQDDTWPEQLAALVEAQTGQPVWVGNAGKAGRQSEHHVLAIKHLAPQIPDLDVVVILVGANDLLARLSSGQAPPVRDWAGEESTPDALYSFFYDWPHQESLASRSRLAWLAGSLQRRTEAARTGVREATVGPAYPTIRGWRQQAVFIDDLPDLTASLDAYEAYLVQMITLADRYQVRLIFATQPAAWHADLPPDFEARLWLGYIGVPEAANPPTEWYTPRALADSMAQYNTRLLAVCARTGAECVDLAAEMSSDLRFFYDDLHFNYEGSRRVAEILAAYLLENP